MKKITNLTTAFIFSTPLLLTNISHADQAQHLYEAAQADSDLKTGFADLVAPVIKKAPWLKDYGTTAPPTKITLEDTDYAVYWGCKPHDCTTESYTVAYNLKTKKMVGGAFVSNQLSGPNANITTIQWLGTTDWELVKALSPYLY